MDGYVLALDGGTCRLVAVVAKATPQQAPALAPCPLGAGGPDVPTAAYLTEDGDVLFGDAAQQLGSQHPERLLRDFVRDVGDGTPLFVGGFAVRADELYARMLAWAVTMVTVSQGAPPALIAVAHPSSWLGHRTDTLRARLRDLGIDDVLLLPAAEAAAQQGFAEGGLPARGVAAVYDFGASGFCGSVLRAQSGGAYRLSDTPVLLDDVGGRNFDHRVLRHALAMASAGTSSDAPAGDPGHGVASLAAVGARRAATAAKEALSFGPEATIDLEFDDRRASVRLTRYEFESVIGADLARTADALERALDVAGVDPPQVNAIVLAGGSSRIPAVVEHLSARFDLPLYASDPHVAAVFGAARAGWAAHEARRSAALESTAEDAAVPAQPPAPAPAPRPHRSRPVRVRPVLSGAVALSVGTLLVAGAAFATTLPGGAQDEAVGETPPTAGLDLPLEWTPGATPADGTSAGPAAQPVTQLGPVFPVDDEASQKRSSTPPSLPRGNTPSSRPTSGSTTSGSAPGGTGTAAAPSRGSTPTPPPTSTPTPDPASTSNPTPTPTPDPTPSPSPDPTPSGEPTIPPVTPAPDPGPAPTPDPAPTAPASAEPTPDATTPPATP